MRDNQNVTITIRLDPKVYDEIKKRADDYGISFNSMLKIILKESLKVD